MTTRSREEIRRRTRRRYGDITEGKLERWLGKDIVEAMHVCSSGLTIPVPVFGVPVFAYKGDIIPAYEPQWMEDGRVAAMTGFSSLSDLISEATTGGKAQDIIFSKSGPTGVAGVTSSLWTSGTSPAAGVDAAAPPGGTVDTRASTGALGQQDPGGSDTLHLTTMTASADRATMLLLYDRLFATTTAANPGTGAITVTGAQTRYTGAAGTLEYPAGVFITNRVTVVLPATAHNITYGYTDQDNNAGASSGANTGVASAIVQRVDMVGPQFTSLLAAGDTGVRQLTSITFSASPATGQVEHSLGRPIAMMPLPIASTGFVLDGINSAFNLVKIQVGACLTFLDVNKTGTQAALMAGLIRLVSG